jgi:hypothetical protein
MDDQPLKTNWMWPASSGGVHGLSIEPERWQIVWYDDAAGSACGSSAAEQTFDEFLQRGPALPDLPEEVLEEVLATLDLLMDPGLS